MKKFKYITVAEFMKDAKPCNLEAEVEEKLRKERENELIDEDWLRRAQAWSYLSQKIVGAEG